MHKLKPEYITLNAEERLYNSQLPILGLTGGIASGKSSVSKLLLSKGIRIIDADSIVKEVYNQHQTLLYIKNSFPSTITDENKINFKLLREIVFQDNTLKEQLEAFIYKKMPTIFTRELNRYIDSGAHFVIYDAPLIFEKSLQTKLDQTLLVYTSEEEQLRRLIHRDQISSELAQNIINKQMPLQKKLELASYVVDNQQDSAHLKAEVTKLIKKYTS